MTRILLLSTLLLLLLAFKLPDPPTGGGEKYPINYFHPPVMHTLLLAGTFGELRPNHFHAGIDIKSSRGVAGDQVFAAADGYVSRIKVDESGYGNALYINHPNGFTTVYAHLDHFTEAVAAYVKKQQYAKKSFEVDLNPAYGEFTFHQGEQIGVMGNSGSSNGAHLHFEIRKTSNQKPINPLLFGFHVTDNVPPKMHALKAYFLNDKLEEQGAKEFPLIKIRNGRYKIKGDTLELAAWRTGLALKVYDHFDRVSNWNGIYSLNMYQDGQLIYEFDMESFSFNESRYINAHCDYEERITKKSYFNRCFHLPGNKLSIYHQQVNSGVIDLYQGKPSHIKMVAADVAGNETVLEFWVRRSKTPAMAVSGKTYNYIFPYDEGNLIRTEGLYLHLPKGTLYENLYLKYEVTEEHSDGCFSQVHRIHNYRTPVHKYFDIGIRPTASIPAELKPKVFVAYCQGGDVWNCGGKWKEGLLRARVRAFGDYCIMVDETPPVITPVAFKYNMKGYNKMKFKVTDNVETIGHVRAIKYKATVDGKWILMEFDKKNDMLIYRFDDKVGPGDHVLRISVKDAVGNEVVFEEGFIR
ncbi:MAG TPA: M23 family metallopeptidase [Bacteroidetes bacterium]|nr:M23 family metallopeptidase [Bacteroidota bacterium]